MNYNIDNLAKELFNNKDFNSCTDQQQQTILKKLLDYSTIKQSNKY